MKETAKIYKGTLIYAIGNFGSSVLSFLMFPVYSYFLTPAEYGTYDVILSAMALLLPLFTLQVPESIMRFAVEEEKETLISTSIAICIMSMIFSSAAGCVFSYIKGFSVSVVLWLELQLIAQYCMQITRALGRNAVYSLNSIISTAVITVSNIVMLICLKLGLNAMIASGIIGAACSVIFLFYKSGLWQYLSEKSYSSALLKKMIRFSVPLIPTALIWWVMDSSDKFVINHFLGSEANGIYAVSYKFPTIVTRLYGFYNLSWQDYIFLKKEKTDFGPIIRQFVNLIVYGSICVMSFAKLVSQYFVEESYYSSYLYIPPLIAGMVFYCFSGFFGIAYRKENRTYKEFTTAVLGTVINVAVNLLFIQRIGLWSAAMSTMVSFMAVAAMRYVDTESFFRYGILNRENRNCFLSLVLFTMLYYFNNLAVSIAACVLSLVLFILFNRPVITDVISIFKDKMIKK